MTVLRNYDEAFRGRLRDAVRARGNDPLAVFDALAERFASDEFRGCAAINTMVEIADPASLAHQVATASKRSVIDYLDELLAAAGHAEHAALAEQFMLLIDGALVTALRERNAAPALRARAIAAALLAQSEPANPAEPTNPANSTDRAAQELPV